jgi:predicted aminopeptidase
MVSDYADLKKAWGGYAGYDRWFNEPVSNAHFALIATYHELVPEFRALMAEEKTLPNFYQRVKQLAKMDAVSRRQILMRHTSLVHHSDIKIQTDAPAALQ